MFPCKMPFAAASRFVGPDDFINEIFLTEDFIHDYFYIMNAVPVQMNPDGPFP